MPSEHVAAPAVEPAPEHKLFKRVNAQGRTRSAAQRLEELRRALQRQLKRKANEIEKTALDRAAIMTLRAEMAALDPKASSEDIVRLDNASRRARQDFERIAGIKPRPIMPARDMRDVNRELAHVR